MRTKNGLVPFVGLICVRIISERVLLMCLKEGLRTVWYMLVQSLYCKAAKISWRRTHSDKRKERPNSLKPLSECNDNVYIGIHWRYPEENVQRKHPVANLEHCFLYAAHQNN